MAATAATAATEAEARDVRGGNGDAPQGCRPMSRAEYEQMVELGWFEDERVELVRGEVVTMSPKGPFHDEVVTRLAEKLVVALAGRARVRVQCAFAASDRSEPEPDLAVVAPGDYSAAHPDRALLIVEVADTSLARDRGTKATLYASSGVPEYWIVNLLEQVVEVYREPASQPTSDDRPGGYRSVARYRSGQAVSPAQFSDVRIAVDDLL